MLFQGGRCCRHNGLLSALSWKSLRRTGAPGNCKPCFSKRSFLLFFCSVLLVLSPSIAFSYNVLFTTRTATPNAGEQLRIDLLTGWGHTVTLVEDSSTQAVYDAAIAISDVAYISEESQSGSVSTKLTNACIGVVTEDPDTVDELGLAVSQAVSFYNSSSIYISDLSHYITQPFAGTGFGSYTLFTTQLRLNRIDLTDPADVAPGLQVHAWPPTDSNFATLATVEIGGTMVGGGSAAGRRVMLPWGDHQTTESDFITITANGETIMQRAVEWAADVSGCLGLTKKAFLTDGTPVTNGAALAKGTEVHFLIYINNTGTTARNDVSVQDVLVPGFGYQSPSLRTATMPACALSVCTTGEEQTIYNTVVATGVKTDAVDLTDEVSYNSGTTTVDAGNQNVANQQLDIAASSLWSLLMTVRVR